MNIKHRISKYNFSGSSAVNADSELCFLLSAQISPMECLILLEPAMFPNSSHVSRSRKRESRTNVNIVPKSSA